METVFEELTKLYEASTGYVSPYLNLSDADRQAAKDEYIKHFGGTGWKDSVQPGDYNDVDAFHRGWDKDLFDISNDTGVDIFAIIGPQTKQIKKSTDYGTIARAAEARGFTRVGNDPIISWLANFWTAQWSKDSSRIRPTKDEYEAAVKQAQRDKTEAEERAKWNAKLEQIINSAYNTALTNLSSVKKDIVDYVEKATKRKLHELNSAVLTTVVTKQDGTIDEYSKSKIECNYTVNVPMLTLHGYDFSKNETVYFETFIEDEKRLEQRLTILITTQLFSTIELDRYKQWTDKYLESERNKAKYADFVNKLLCARFVEDIRSYNTGTAGSGFGVLKVKILVTDFDSYVYMLNDYKKKIYDLLNEEAEVDVNNLPDATKFEVVAIIVDDEFDSMKYYSYNALTLQDIGMDEPDTSGPTSRVLDMAGAVNANKNINKGVDCFFTVGMTKWVAASD